MRHKNTAERSRVDGRQQPARSYLHRKKTLICSLKGTVVSLKESLAAMTFLTLLLPYSPLPGKD